MTMVTAIMFLKKQIEREEALLTRVLKFVGCEFHHSLVFEISLFHAM